ncbi:hypothetical protein ACFWF7_32580 [Nocardia sp. NPDC060256]|uniref:hypothetical protein n=1 Tax=unclassified Nocardia TaxID=2637762 RepID=UPI00364B5C43
MTIERPFGLANPVGRLVRVRPPGRLRPGLNIRIAFVATAATIGTSLLIGFRRIHSYGISAARLEKPGLISRG